MHRCLLIPEVVIAIMEQTDEVRMRMTRRHSYNRETKGQMHPAVALGLCCRSLYRHAVSVLWRELPGIEPLLACLPDHVWSSTQKDIKVYFSPFVRISSMSNWCLAAGIQKRSQLRRLGTLLIPFIPYSKSLLSR